ncbi:hypothetical protein WA026_006001 [Henosepilachna vigintioctopunctata]|uniref:SWIM-type domain-containing protein n=1 Tax=Henosepilachna vigintioctopunctata TaxID=420089 RepID=A0AAW1U527_9CUCU
MAGCRGNGDARLEEGMQEPDGMERNKKVVVFLLGVGEVILDFPRRVFITWNAVSFATTMACSCGSPACSHAVLADVIRAVSNLTDQERVTILKVLARDELLKREQHLKVM